MIRISALRTIPDFVQGYVRDITVRWTLAELSLEYEVRLIANEELVSEEYRRLQPFGQVPMFEDTGIFLFESGAIVLHLAERSDFLLPDDPKKRALVKSWMFAAMNSIDPMVRNLEQVEFISPDADWAKLRHPELVALARRRLTLLSDAMKGQDFLVETFSAADILMTMVLRILAETAVFHEFADLVAYVKRCEARPAFNEAMDKHLSAYR